ncbi:MAG TPA: DUF3857 domain-containing protein [Puia sp.]|jgi:hypothetical protein|nr:DUF3857 domain-containing protein [Puia sp.]
MRNFLLALPLLLLTPPASSQNIVHEDWVANPVLHKLDARYSKESAIILSDKRRIEYIDQPKDEIGEYRTLHKIIRVMDDNGIESFNKIYLGYNDPADIIAMRARTILPNGSVKEIRKEDMKDVQEEDGSKYKIFAMEGLEKGAEIEYFYTLKREADFFGHESLQGKFPIVDAEVDILCPDRLVFQMKGYNCALTVGDTSDGKTRTFSTRLGNIPGADEEKYAAYEANLQRLEYRLSYNTAGGNEHVRLNTWNLLAQRIHEGYETNTEKELSRVGNFIKDNGWDKLTDDRQKIVAVENFLKKNVTTREDIETRDAGNLEWIIKNKIATHRGIIRLYAAIFNKLGIEHQIVLTCDRSEKSIDKSFENWNNASDLVFYFPSTKKFLAPTLLQMRYPWINPYWGAEDALYCQTTTIGNYTTAIALVKPVPLEDFSQSFTRIDASIQFDKGLDSLLIDLKHSFGGYGASGYRAAFTLGTPDQQHELLKDLVKSATNSERIVSSKIENAAFESYSDNKPLIVQATVKSDGLLENAGNKLLVKIGEIIGSQVEMYQEKPRQFPVQVAYPQTEERFITFIIPDGYTIRNPGDLVIRHEYKEGDVVTMGFASDYKLDGRTLTVHILEQYRRTSYPISQYEEFKKVINAAADFSKVSLILQKS